MEPLSGDVVADHVAAKDMTTLVGFLARCRLSRFGIPWFARHDDIDRVVLDRPLQEFRSLGFQA